MKEIPFCSSLRELKWESNGKVWGSIMKGGQNLAAQEAEELLSEWLQKRYFQTFQTLEGYITKDIYILYPI
jgi:hypothetical protein